ncbi:ABC transporter ATP-binding protein [Phreatobacter sp. AB_2022a]|uniref:ABC transporter ATP-binding protein n=1 Tax=Phreatobacter sp. AB_2022a TaxID=3003134 RepID=UPI0022870D81|nr:ABC transporter ATP-binding protein [Phreatobacter sp. AB_2022a]MCZ0734293.1 ABC transporter ATP-binding protein [Phreatobacter sp. AB_2022a]
MAEVELQGVTKAFNGQTAVNDVSFSVAPGHLVALLGPSGCGKSTTLRLIAGLEQSTAGTIHIAARDVTHAGPAERGVSMVFQSYALFPHLTVAQNILFGLEVRKVPKAERSDRLKRAADMLGLAALLDRKPSQLSGGQQQRVALGRAIVAQTPVCLMDEPLSNLDAQLRLDMRREIRGLQRRLGVTMIYVTHDQVEAMTMADRIVLMRQGRVEQYGTPDELYGRPATVFTARFVGTPPMNVVPLALLGGEGKRFAPATHDAASVSLGIRPEHIRLGEAGIHGTVTAVEYLGADSLVDVRVGAGADQANCLVRVPGKAGLGEGDDVRLDWNLADTHHFDTVSGRRIA